MKSFRVCIILFIGMFLMISIGCSDHSNKIYGYKVARYEYKDGEVRAKLMGSHKTAKHKKETISGSPYKLLITFESYSKAVGTVRLKSADLRDSDTRETAFRSENVLIAKFKKDSDGTYCTRFSVVGLDLEYVSYVLILKFEIESDKSSVKKDVELNFKKDYKEYRSNEFWDKIMSV